MINIKNLCFSYEKSCPHIINNLNLNIQKGVYLSIIGDNGSCKTTLIKLILGLLSPTSGSIELDTTKIGYVPQKIEAFNSQFPISVYEILKIHAKTLKIDVSSSIASVLEIVHMSNFKHKLIGNLSGGQQQRVFIARALMGNPDLIILDEPSTGVDYKTQHEIYSILNKINKEQKTTIISIEHNLNIALKYSSHMLKIDSGNAKLSTSEDFKNTISLEGA